jgi:hypothetical protein
LVDDRLRALRGETSPLNNELSPRGKDRQGLADLCRSVLCFIAPPALLTFVTNCKSTSVDGSPTARRPAPDKGSDMSVETPYISNYQRRIQLIENVIGDSKKDPGTDAAGLAERILAAIDHIPERVR